MTLEEQLKIEFKERFDKKDDDFGMGDCEVGTIAKWWTDRVYLILQERADAIRVMGSKNYDSIDTYDCIENAACIVEEGIKNHKK